MSRFGGFAIEPVSLAIPLLVSALIGAIGGVNGERILPTKRTR